MISSSLEDNPALFFVFFFQASHCLESNQGGIPPQGSDTETSLRSRSGLQPARCPHLVGISQVQATLLLVFQGKGQVSGEQIQRKEGYGFQSQDLSRGKNIISGENSGPRTETQEKLVRMHLLYFCMIFTFINCKCPLSPITLMVY